MKRDTHNPLTNAASTLPLLHLPCPERRNQLRQLCCVLALAAAGLVQAAPVTYYFGGHLSWVDPDLSPTLAVGNGFSGSFTYESTTADSAPSDPNQGFYPPGPAFTVTINGLPFSIAGGGSGSVAVYNDFFGIDRFSANSEAAGPSINGYSPEVFEINLQDPTQSTFSSDALPASELDLALFGSSNFTLSFYNFDPLLLFPTAAIAGPLSYLSLTDPNAITSIPEPGSLVLLGLGLAGLGASIKRSRSRISNETTGG